MSRDVRKYVTKSVAVQRGAGRFWVFKDGKQLNKAAQSALLKNRPTPATLTSRVLTWCV
jgi:hypothetical protein